MPDIDLIEASTHLTYLPLKRSHILVWIENPIGPLRDPKAQVVQNFSASSISIIGISSSIWYFNRHA